KRGVELFNRPLDCQIDRLGLMRNGDRLLPLGPSFDLTALVLAASLVAVLIGDMHNDAGHLFIKALQLAADTGTYPLCQPRTAFNVIIAMNLNLHKLSLFILIRKPAVLIAV